MPKNKRTTKLIDLPVGTKVRMINCYEARKHDDKVWITNSEPWELRGSQVVKLEGYSGGFDTSCLEVVSDASI
jgi:hypothetical protein